MKYLFPFKLIPPNSHIILYGASDVGYDFYRQVMSSGYTEIVAWLDMNYKMYRHLGLPVDSPDEIAGIDCEYIVVAVLERSSYVKIREYLTGQGIPDGKIIWHSSPIVEYDIAKKYAIENVTADMKDAMIADPINLIDENRMDIIVRILYAKEIISESPGIGEELYEKMFLAMNDATEPTDHFLFRYFSDYDGKKGIESFKSAFKQLIISMREEGFKKEGFIPLNSYGRMINGSHRCAAAVALDKRVWVRRYPIDGVRIADHYFGKEWFIEKGFTKGEVNLLLDELENLKRGNE